jgi:hypothetical protein
MKTTKTKIPQPKNDKSNRNNFQTPIYALNLLLPYIPMNVKKIWECAAGQMRLSDKLFDSGYKVYSSDKYPLRKDCYNEDFLESQSLEKPIGNIDCIITNPPFSLKFDFITKALEYDIPFAFLIPFDMCGFLHKKFSQGLQAIVPERRIDYLTPNIVERINIGEGLFAVNKKFRTKYKNLNDIEMCNDANILKCYEDNKRNFKDLDDDIPYELLKKYSSSDFHSFWIVSKFNLKNQFTFVPLSPDDKRNIL